MPLFTSSVEQHNKALLLNIEEKQIRAKNDIIYRIKINTNPHGKKLGTISISLKSKIS